MLVHSASALPFWKSVRPQPPISRVSPVKTRSRHRYETLPGVCPGVAIVRISSCPKRITSPSPSRRSYPCALQSRQTAVCAPVASLSACAAVTWSACTWVSSVYLRARPCSRNRRTSRSTCSATGSISTASWFESSAIRYVRVDDAGSKSCLKNMASSRFGTCACSGGRLQQLRSRARHLDLIQPLESQRLSSIIVQIVLRGRAQVGGVVVGSEKVRDQLVPRPRVGLRDPAVGHRVADRWIAQTDSGAWDELVADLLATHYDPSYLRAATQNYLHYDGAQALTLERLDEIEMPRAAAELLKAPA